MCLAWNLLPMKQTSGFVAVFFWIPFWTCSFIEVITVRTKVTDWSFAEKTFVKQSMMLCAFEILLKNGRKIGGNRSSMNLSSVVGQAWAVTHELSCVTGPTWVVTRERPCRYKSTSLVTLFAITDGEKTFNDKNTRTSLVWDILKANHHCSNLQYHRRHVPNF